MESELLFSWPVWAAIGTAIFAAAVTQGTFGFGFPVISTPVLVLLTDVKTAIVINLLPNLVVNIIDVIRGGNWGTSLGRHWRVALYVVIGAFAGAQFLIFGPADLLRLLLALMIFAYLAQERLARLDWSWLTRYPRSSELGFGLIGGFFSGTVNVSVPPLLIYFMLLGVETTALTQILNLCFLGGRTTQAVTLGFAGEIRLTAALAYIPLTAVAIGGLYIGAKLQRRFSAQTYRRALKRILFVIAIVLTYQGARYFVS